MRMRKIFASLSVLLVYSELTRFSGHVFLSDMWYFALLFRKTYYFYYIEVYIYTYTRQRTLQCVVILFSLINSNTRIICSLVLICEMQLAEMLSTVFYF